MRSVIVLGLVLGACSDEGAHLTLQAPAGPPGATSFQVVLASPELVPVVANQRTSPKATTVETVTYYLQRTAAGVTGGPIDHVDGFTILVEPDASVADTAFIPFVLLYDDAQHLVGVGTYHADPQSAQPSPLIVKRHEVDLFPIDVEPLTEVVDTLPVDPGDSMQVTCARDNSTFVSGVVWRPRTGGELRLMFPDQPNTLDATSRKLDMDCDDQEVAQDASGTDCDDTRARFHDGATELCDGEDWNCDGIRYAIVPCTGTGTCTVANTGVALCDDTTGTVGTCSEDAACACAGGSTSCTKCVLTFGHGVAPTEVSPCQPGVGTLSTEGACEGAPCVVSVVGTRNGWQVLVATSTSGTFGPTALGVTSSFAIKARRPEGPGFSMKGAANGSVGTADVVILSADGTKKLVSVDLELASQQSTCSGNGPFAMACSP